MSIIHTATQTNIALGIVLSFLAFSAKADSNTLHCPTEFYQLPLISSASYCQSFAQELPASLSYFTASSQDEVKNFYINALGQAEQEFIEKGRLVMLYKQGMQTIIVSPDKQGSQIDMLVKQ
ncbi:hypothetical protein [Paraglaciecola hydrolytica]|uniref:Uncharacterized protein n=1 Tax=Paraglaciecola hydrolytica TaxID=1799789 RepID=A0A136A1Z8_9ALTE|nr:hypothetical protein [Paraglaciecola hydrolytica]KXI29255.1 hypothetical protein AX660_14005 [Paraglaciecola hydrolytica]